MAVDPDGIQSVNRCQYRFEHGPTRWHCAKNNRHEDSHHPRGPYNNPRPGDLLMRSADLSPAALHETQLAREADDAAAHRAVHDSPGDAGVGLGAGKKDDGGKVRWDLVFWEPIVEYAKVLTFGAKKYAANSWQDVDNGEERYFAALIRHLVAWREGERYDEDSGLHHLGHALCNLCFLFWFDKRRLGATKPPGYVERFGVPLDQVDFDRSDFAAGPCPSINYTQDTPALDIDMRPTIPAALDMRPNTDGYCDSNCPAFCDRSHTHRKDAVYVGRGDGGK